MSVFGHMQTTYIHDAPCPWGHNTNTATAGIATGCGWCHGYCVSVWIDLEQRWNYSSMHEHACCCWRPEPEAEHSHTGWTTSTLSCLHTPANTIECTKVYVYQSACTCHPSPPLAMCICMHATFIAASISATPTSCQWYHISTTVNDTETEKICPKTLTNPFTE